jgi:NAD(P)-dependent dehydrogenase (short-subunit alcohol dehydrogenase family)
MTLNALITGPTNGIGKATALTLAQQGYKLFLLCRNRELGQALCDEISATPNAIEPTLLIADLADFAQIRAAVDEFLSLKQPLHVLINNAGIVNTQRVIAFDHEQMFKVNHLGHFLLTQLLLPILKASAPSRIVIVSSGAHAFIKGIQFDDISFEHSFSTFPTYGHSKLANLLMMQSLVHLLKGSGVTVNALHPGAVASSLGKNNKVWYAGFISALLKPFFLTPDQGAKTSIHLATNDISSSGGYYYKCKLTRMKPWAEDHDAAKKLWHLSEEWVAKEH